VALAEIGLAKARRGDGIFSPPSKDRVIKNTIRMAFANALKTASVLFANASDSRKINSYYFTGINRTQ